MVSLWRKVFRYSISWKMKLIEWVWVWVWVSASMCGGIRRWSNRVRIFDSSFTRATFVYFTARHQLMHRTWAHHCRCVCVSFNDTIKWHLLYQLFDRVNRKIWRSFPSVLNHVFHKISIKVIFTCNHCIHDDATY